MTLRTLEGKHPKVDPMAFVSEAAYVLGDVEIGPESSVWPGAVIRGDMGKVRVGRATNIQDNSVVHSDGDAEYGDYVTLGHGVVCHAKKVGNHVVIGNGAVVNDGVEIGDYSIVAAGAVVLEDVKIPARSMVMGIPGQVRAQIQPRHEELIAHYAQEYIDKTARYLKHGGLGS